MEYRARQGGLVWPIILIGAGCLFLLNNLGIVSWSVWSSLWRLWPLVLIAIGLDLLIGRRSLLVSLLIALVVLGLMGALVSNMATQAVGSAGFHTVSINQGLEGATDADVDLNPSVANLRIGAAAESAGLVDGTLTLAGTEQAEPRFWRTGNTAHFELHAQGGLSVTTFNVDQQQKPWDLNFNPDVPLRLKINTGVGNSTLDLSHLKVNRLAISGGVGNATITVPRAGQVNVTLDGGVGRLRVIIPKGMAARIVAEGGLGGVDVKGTFQQSGKTYTTPDYTTANDRTDIRINGGIGGIAVEQGG